MEAMTRYVMSILLSLSFTRSLNRWNQRLILHLFVSMLTKGGFQKRCTYIEPSFTSRGMKLFMQQNHWFVQKCTRWDNVLHQIANRSLDSTIETKLGGRPKFERQLEKFQQARALAQERCQPKMPCTAQGVKLNFTETDCLWADSGCGYKCLDELATELGLWQMEY